ncbi:UNC-like C-terminal-domain-containing protein, partial [Cerioporus squamosus]
GEPDYALWSAGGRIVPQLTSKTYVPPSRWWTGAWDGQSVDPRPPELAITPDIHAGCCWPMRGNHGSLGIRLADEIVPRAVTVDHLAVQLQIRNDTAPRDVSIWGVQAKGRTQSDTGTLPVMNITFDIHARLPTQTFNLSKEAADLHLTVETLLFMVENNWGNDAYTCIYRVRAHG